MAEVLFVLVYLVYSLIVVRGPLGLVGLVRQTLETFVLVGLLSQALDFLGFKIDFSQLVFGLVLATFLRVLRECYGKRDYLQRNASPRIYLLTSLILAAAIGLVRFLSPGQSTIALTNIGFLGAEDNAKWLNVVAEMASGNKIQFSGVGGICVAFLAAVAAIFSVVAPLFGFVVNEVSIVISTVALGSLILLVSLPLMFLLAEEKSPSPVLMNCVRLIGTLFGVASSVRLSHLGHLSAQIFVLYVVALVNLALAETKNDNYSRNGSLFLLAIGSSSIWLPLQLTSGVIAFGFGCYLVYTKLRAKQISLKNSCTIKFFLIAPCAGIVTWNTLMYAQGGSKRIESLFAAKGGVNTFSTFEWSFLLLLIAVFFSGQALSAVINYRITVVVTCVVILGLSIYHIDYFFTTDFNYGAQKLGYMIATVLISTLLSPSFSALLNRFPSRTPTIHFLPVVLMLTMVLTINGSLISWVDLLRQATWPQTEEVSESGWRQFLEIRNTKDQKLDDLPISCGVRTEVPNILSLDYNTYLCTRILSGVAGLENQGGGTLVEWQLRGDIEKSADYLTNLSSKLKSRAIVILNPDGSVYRTTRLSTIIN